MTSAAASTTPGFDHATHVRLHERSGRRVFWAMVLVGTPVLGLLLEVGSDAAGRLAFLADHHVLAMGEVVDGLRRQLWRR